MKHDFDAIVIGAGPAGSTFARIASEGGMNVLVIDKRKEIGNPVRCGEALGFSEVVREGLDLPKHCFSTIIEGAKLVAPNGKSIVWKGDGTKGYMLERKFFDKWLSEMAVEKGATVKSYTRAVEVTKDEKGKFNGVKISHGGRDIHQVTAPLIVSAEGMESLMARNMGFKTVHALYDVDTCYEYEMRPYDHENLIELYFGNKVAPRGYVWIFPKANRKANVGIGIGANITNATKRGGVVGADPKILLDEFNKNHEKLKDASTLLDFGGVISVGAPINEFVKDNAMVVGTAAKQVDPIHGGGIALAMGAGVMAAKTALKAHAKKDYSKQTLFEYEKEWRSGEGKICADRLLLRKTMEKLTDDDLNHIFNQVNPPELKNLMEGKFAPVVAKVLATRPQLLGVLSALIGK